MAKTFDEKCFELAKYFLQDEPRLNTPAACTTLAQTIQQAVEDEIEFMKSTMEKA